MIFNSMLNILGFCSSILGSSGSYWNVTGITYVGNGAAGNGLNQLNAATGIFVDSNDTLYISDAGNYRILSYLSNAANPTVAVSGSSGTALNTFSTSMRYIYVDTSGNIYIADKSNNRVVRWASGGSTGVVVAGNNGAGAGLNQLNSPYGIWVDSSSNVFVAEYSNHRVTKWVSGASAGVVVAGITGSAGNLKSRTTTYTVS
jgi:sugar lactone lactonase YvrE